MPSKKTRLLLNKKAAVTENSPQTLQNDPSPAPKMDDAAASLCSSAVPVTNIGRVDSKIQQAKQFAIAQAQKDGCVGNFKSFNSHFGNYLVPVIPTEADLNV